MEISEEKIREIIREELGYMTDRQVFNKHTQILDARNIQLGRGTGTKIGTATDQKIAFFGQTPVDKPDTIADPSGGGSAGVDTPARNVIAAIIDRLQELGLIA
jgi:hypothetical protein